MSDSSDSPERRYPKRSGRSSGRLKKKSMREFVLPDKAEILANLVPEGTPTKNYEHLRPRKLVSEYVKTRNRYNNPDGIDLFDDDTLADFINDDTEEDQQRQKRRKRESSSESGSDWNGSEDEEFSEGSAVSESDGVLDDDATSEASISSEDDDGESPIAVLSSGDVEEVNESDAQSVSSTEEFMQKHVKKSLKSIPQRVTSSTWWKTNKGTLSESTKKRRKLRRVSVEESDDSSEESPKAVKRKKRKCTISDEDDDDGREDQPSCSNVQSEQLNDKNRTSKQKKTQSSSDDGDSDSEKTEADTNEQRVPTRTNHKKKDKAKRAPVVDDDDDSDDVENAVPASLNTIQSQRTASKRNTKYQDKDPDLSSSSDDTEQSENSTTCLENNGESPRIGHKNKKTRLNSMKKKTIRSLELSSDSEPDEIDKSFFSRPTIESSDSDIECPRSVKRHRRALEDEEEDENLKNVQEELDSATEGNHGSTPSESSVSINDTNQVICVKTTCLSEQETSDKTHQLDLSSLESIPALNKETTEVVELYHGSSTDKDNIESSLIQEGASNSETVPMLDSGEERQHATEVIGDKPEAATCEVAVNDKTETDRVDDVSRANQCINMSENQMVDRNEDSCSEIPAEVVSTETKQVAVIDEEKEPAATVDDYDSDDSCIECPVPPKTPPPVLTLSSDDEEPPPVSTSVISSTTSGAGWFAAPAFGTSGPFGGANSNPLFGGANSNLPFGGANSNPPFGGANPNPSFVGTNSNPSFVGTNSNPFGQVQGQGFSFGSANSYNQQPSTTGMPFPTSASQSGSFPNQSSPLNQLGNYINQSSIFNNQTPQETNLQTQSPENQGYHNNGQITVKAMLDARQQQLRQQQLMNAQNRLRMANATSTSGSVINHSNIQQAHNQMPATSMIQQSFASSQNRTGYVNSNRTSVPQSQHDSSSLNGVSWGQTPNTQERRHNVQTPTSSGSNWGQTPNSQLRDLVQTSTNQNIELSSRISSQPSVNQNFQMGNRFPGSYPPQNTRLSSNVAANTQMMRSNVRLQRFQQHPQHLRQQQPQLRQQHPQVRQQQPHPRLEIFGVANNTSSTPSAQTHQVTNNSANRSQMPRSCVQPSSFVNRDGAGNIQVRRANVCTPQGNSVGIHANNPNAGIIGGASNVSSTQGFARSANILQGQGGSSTLFPQGNGIIRGVPNSSRFPANGNNVLLQSNPNPAFESQAIDRLKSFANSVQYESQTADVASLNVTNNMFGAQGQQTSNVGNIIFANTVQQQTQQTVITNVTNTYMMNSTTPNVNQTRFQQPSRNNVNFSNQQVTPYSNATIHVPSNMTTTNSNSMLMPSNTTGIRPVFNTPNNIVRQRFQFQNTHGQELQRQQIMSNTVHLRASASSSNSSVPTLINRTVNNQMIHSGMPSNYIHQAGVNSPHPLNAFQNSAFMSVAQHEANTKDNGLASIERILKQANSVNIAGLSTEPLSSVLGPEMDCFTDFQTSGSEIMVLDPARNRTLDDLNEIALASLSEHGIDSGTSLVQLLDEPLPCVIKVENAAVAAKHPAPSVVGPKATISDVPAVCIANEPAAVIVADEPAAAFEPAAAIVADEPAAAIVNNEPSAIVADEPAAAIVNNEPSAIVADEPAAAIVADESAVAIVADEPAAAIEPSAAIVADEPATSVTDIPVSSLVSNKAPVQDKVVPTMTFDPVTTAVADKQPTLADEPMITTSADDPAPTADILTDTAVDKPTTTVIDEPVANVNAKSVSRTVDKRLLVVNKLVAASACDPISPIVLDEPISPAVINEPISPAMNGPISPITDDRITVEDMDQVNTDAAVIKTAWIKTTCGKEQSGIQTKQVLVQCAGKTSSSGKTLTEQIPGATCNSASQRHSSNSHSQSSKCTNKIDRARWKQQSGTPVVVLRDILSQIKSVKFDNPAGCSNQQANKRKIMDVQPGKQFLVKQKCDNDGVDIIDKTTKTKIEVRKSDIVKQNEERLSRTRHQNASSRMPNQTSEINSHAFSTDSSVTHCNNRQDLISTTNLTRQGRQINGVSVNVTRLTLTHDQVGNDADSPRETSSQRGDNHSDNSTDDSRPIINNNNEKSVHPSQVESKTYNVLEIPPAV